MITVKLSDDDLEDRLIGVFGHPIPDYLFMIRSKLLKFLIPIKIK